MNIHSAFTIPFKDLIAGLENECDLGNVNKRSIFPLTQYTYTQQCTYNAAWSIFSMSARGIIVDDKQIIATPFPKFFNLSENKVEIPNLPFQAYEKVDGSLIITFYYNGEWLTATKGSFHSDQALAAKKFLYDHPHILENLSPEVTYNFEYIGPTNRIVVGYEKEDLILLGAYHNEYGNEVPWNIIEYLSETRGIHIAKTYSFADLNSVVEHCLTLDLTEEGYVLRYEDGTRVKIKGSEYCRVHALISNVTPLAIWRMMMSNDNMEFIRSQLPEEFLTDFDDIVRLIDTSISMSIYCVETVYEQTKHLTDKELGLILHTLDSDVKKLLFPYRKSGGKFLEDKRCREALFRMHRPNGNVLCGYVPSSSMNRVQEDG